MLTLPPLVEPSPAVTRTLPPSELLLLPTLTSMPPLLPAAALPVAIETAPLLPVDAFPLLKDTEPLSTALAADWTDTLPLSLPAPLSTRMAPPRPITALPACIEISPPCPA